MRTSLLGVFILLIMSSTILGAQRSKSFEIKSPDNKISVKFEIGDKMLWSVQHDGQQIIAPSSISMQLKGGEVLGDHAKITGSKAEKIDQVITAFNYKKARIPDQYNQLTVNCKSDYGVVFRVYNDGVAYRFVTRKKADVVVQNEEANFNFTADHKAFIPYMWNYNGGEKFNHSFEALYKEINISKFASDSLAFLPLLVDVGNNKKVVILEADLEDYPGMYLNINSTIKGFMGVYAPYPLDTKLNGMNLLATKRADYIARTVGVRNFPWRAIVISSQDKDLLNNDMVQKLASPSRISDPSWIKPGLAAWDWWSDWNISHVDFKAGYNTPTYKYYIDFAAANKLPYIVMDAGWSGNRDILKVTADVDIQELVNYGKQKGVGIVLWATWYAVTQQMNEAFSKYAKMGIKGFKIDFIDRDDQVAVASLYEIAKKAAEYHLIVDYHGAYKPTGLQRTYPNVVGFEGVKGLENYKWATEDQPRYTVSIPFIRMMAGPLDYTPGAMRNTNKANYRPVGDMPFSQGTRCNQMAMFVVYEAPFQMMSDNPTTYMKEQECTDFIARIPTITDETFALDGKVGEYAALARKKGETWFVGAMSNWTPREITLNLSFLGAGNYQATVFKDGINADRDATDYKKEVLKVSSIDKVKIQLAPGGGWVARIEKDEFIKVENGQFIRNGKPYFYIGTNYWYGAILGSPGKEGNRQRLIEELDLMKANGITNLRVLAGAEGPNGEPRRVSPALQLAPGVYNKELLEGLDFLLAEMGKRKMVAILFLNNAWEWSGGFSQYVSWSEKKPIPYPEVAGHTWGEFMAFSGTFHQSAGGKEMFRNHIKYMLGRTNQITGIPYSNDPAIMTWELANEPRAFSNANKVPFTNWVNETAAYIKSIDPNHLVTVGSEGKAGCENDIDLFEKIHSSKDVDYMTVHIWPFNWGWLNSKNMQGTMSKAIEKTGKYIDEHLVVAHKLNKPLVFEEFGLPRDGFVFTPGSPVTLRDQYYDYAFSRVLESITKKDMMVGVNFWAFSGMGKPNADRADNMWKAGDDYLGDPPQEAQGLNSVFSNDPTMKIVKKYNDKINSTNLK